MMNEQYKKLHSLTFIFSFLKPTGYESRCVSFSPVNFAATWLKCVLATRTLNCNKAIAVLSTFVDTY